MIVVLDVSAAMQILTHKEKEQKFLNAIDGLEKVIAPDLYVAELTNTLWKCCKAKLFSMHDCHRLIEEGINLVDEFVDSREIWEEAFGEGVKNNHPVYGMYYAVLARKKDGTLITDDAGLAKICKKENIACLI
jgi:predicted nucleic acid-binding protein